MTVTISLYPAPVGQWRKRTPGTTICLNCPLSEKYLSSNGNFYDTCDQSGWHGNRKEEPICLIAQAKFYGVALEDAEKIAKSVGLKSNHKITAWYYTQELKERVTNGR